MWKATVLSALYALFIVSTIFCFGVIGVEMNQAPSVSAHREGRKLLQSEGMWISWYKTLSFDALMFSSCCIVDYVADDDYMAMKGMEVINRRHRKNSRNYALQQRKKKLLRGGGDVDAVPSRKVDSEGDDDRFNFIRPEHLVEQLRRGEAGKSVEPRHRHRFELWKVPEDAES